MDAGQALGELMELSSQITAAVVLDGDGAVLASSEGADGLSSTVHELLAAAADLGAEGREVTRVEVELEEGAIFVVRENGHVVAATTGPSPTSGLVVYDLRTCAQAIDAAPAPRKRRPRKPKDVSE